jgi:hypothetical protein
MFHKLLRAESEELELIVRARTECRAIFGTLTDSLNEGLSKMQDKIDRDERDMNSALQRVRLRGQELTRDLKVTVPDQKFYMEFNMLQKRWGH